MGFAPGWRGLGVVGAIVGALVLEECVELLHFLLDDTIA